MVKTKAIWRESFEKEVKRLKKLFGKDAFDIKHIGSTAIPGIPAKPVIDMGVIVPSLQKAEKLIAALKKIGYAKKEENRRDRLFFTRGSERRRTHYLHIGEAGSGYVEDMILFRDYLRKHKSAAKRYSELKEKLAEKYQNTREIYTAKKEKLIKEIVKKANKSLRKRE